MSELREAIARAMAEANGEPENWEAWLIDADAALAAIDAAGQQIVSKKFSVKPVPGEGLQFKCHFPEGATVTFSRQGIGGGGKGGGARIED